MMAQLSTRLKFGQGNFWASHGEGNESYCLTSEEERRALLGKRSNPYVNGSEVTHMISHHPLIENLSTHKHQGQEASGSRGEELYAKCPGGEKHLIHSP